MDKTIQIAIFASGNGSNAQKIAEYFAGNSDVNICRIYSNKKDAFVLERAMNLKIPSFVFTKKQMNETNSVIEQLINDRTDLIVLAGFLLKIPENIIKEFPDGIVNIHPALLPKFGGKGMYGMRVHEAVKESGDSESGITIHYVNEAYDEGSIIFQAKVQVDKIDSPEDIARKIHKLEYEYFPKIIEKVLNKKL